ncbi:MAG: hypothetical protein PHT79_09800 [Syntrophomonadaceae bacterium]|nr:hypothetical protein [Syntrophomonadaceae bacterium]MDD4550035.1 hypothetical protein [Syntrophomonadaceae bacterium]
MFPLPWYAIILVSIPQTILAIKLGFELFGFKIEIRNCLFVAVVTGIATYFLRQSSLFTGVHTVILIITVALLVTVIKRFNIWHSLACSLLGYMIIGVVEGICLPAFLYLTSTPITDLATNPWLNILSFLPIFLTLVILYILVVNKNLVVYNLNN